MKMLILNETDKISRHIEKKTNNILEIEQQLLCKTNGKSQQQKCIR